jgi:hypothetical protein
VNGYEQKRFVSQPTAPGQNRGSLCGNQNARRCPKNLANNQRAHGDGWSVSTFPISRLKTPTAARIVCSQAAQPLSALTTKPCHLILGQAQTSLIPAQAGGRGSTLHQRGRAVHPDNTESHWRCKLLGLKYFRGRLTASAHHHDNHFRHTPLESEMAGRAQSWGDGKSDVRSKGSPPTPGLPTISGAWLIRMVRCRGIRRG